MVPVAERGLGVSLRPGLRARRGSRRAIGGKAYFGSSLKARRHNNEQESQ